MTKRLYQEDSYRTRFESQVVRRFPEGDRVAIVLEETCFYPTSGGQHCDFGELGGIRVEEVRLDGNEIIHILPSDAIGDRLTGTIDWPRRFDHMQQHSGQHVLSQSFLCVMGLETLSAHLGTDVSTIELPREKISREELDWVEDEANRIITECRPIRAVRLGREEAIERGLRKIPEREGELRIVEVEGYDLSACGGTHCRTTGEVGLIKIAKTERIRRQTRVEFLSGSRALSDYQHRWKWLDEVSTLLGRQAGDVPDAIRKLLEDSASKGKELRRLEDQILGYRAKEMLDVIEDSGDLRIVHAVMEGLSPEGLATLAKHLISESGVVALLGLASEEKGHVVVACSEGAPLDVGSLLRDVLPRWGGRGGGKPAFARGGVGPENLNAAVDDLRREADAALARGRSDGR